MYVTVVFVLFCFSSSSSLLLIFFLTSSSSSASSSSSSFVCTLPYGQLHVVFGLMTEAKTQIIREMY